jgi:5-methylcytosine-specific restriction endonuclease McrA
MAVYVLDKKKQPLMPCSEKRARLLLERGRAVVHKMYPFTVRLKDRVGGALQPLRLKIGPASHKTGIALVRESETVDPVTGAVERVEHVINLIDLEHRGWLISKKLEQRSNMRRGRRHRKTRYRPARFDNRRRPEGWLPPSLQHRVDTTESWCNRLTSLAPIAAISAILHRFDTQKLQNPEISGTEYQQGTLFGYEVREYLLEKWGRTCTYCDADDKSLQVEHILARANGGTDRISNLTLACEPCNQEKGKLYLPEFLQTGKKRFRRFERNAQHYATTGKGPVDAKKLAERKRHEATRLARIQAQGKAPLQDVAAINATRAAVLRMLESTGLPVEISTGGRAKWNRTRFSIPKRHALDAACMGQVDRIEDWDRPYWRVHCDGRGRYQRTNLDQKGRRVSFLPRQKQHHGFQTGDMVRAEVAIGERKGVHVGRVAVRSSGSFKIRTKSGPQDGVKAKDCRLIQRLDGYSYFREHVA